MKFTAVDVYKCDLVDSISLYTDLTHLTYVLTHANLKWLRSLLEMYILTPVYSR